MKCIEGKQRGMKENEKKIKKLFRISFIRIIAEAWFNRVKLRASIKYYLFLLVIKYLLNAVKI